MYPQKNQQGQALMIVILALAAVASVVLTISTRTTTDVSVTTNVEDAQRAFTAAEAGVEKILLEQSTSIGSPIQQNVGDAGATFTATANSIPQNNQEYAYPFDLRSGDVSTLWFMSHDQSYQLSCSGLPCYTGSRIQICWGNPGSSATNAGALEITVYRQGSGNQTLASRMTVDPDSNRRSSNSFGANDGSSCPSIEGQGYAFSKTVNFATDLGIGNYGTAGVLKMMRIRILYNTEPQVMGFRTQGTGSLPTQGVRVDSLGSAGTTSRRLEAYSLYPIIPSMFDAALFSPPGVTKN